jgi:hypothetical protein
LESRLFNHLSDSNFGRTNPAQIEIDNARNNARAALMELLPVLSTYTHPANKEIREKYFAQIQKYADLTDQTFDNAVRFLL